MRKLTGLFLCIISLPAFAQDSTNKSLDEVVVTATRMKQSSVALPYSLVKVNKQYLHEYSPRTTPEALQGINGVFVQKTNHGGGSPFVRGLTGNQTLLLIDGIRLNNATFRYGPNQYLNTVDPYTIDHIEVAKGTGSVQYGSDALGGVVQLFTKDALFSDRPALHGSVTGKYMTNNMEKTVRGAIDYRSQKLGFTGGFSYRNFGDLYGGDTTGKQSPSGYDEKAFDAKLKLLLNPSSHLVIANQFVKQDGVPVYHKVVLENFRVNEMKVQQRSLQYIRYVNELNGRLIKNLEATASWQQHIEERDMQKNNSSVVTNEKDKINTLGVTVSAFTEFTRNWSSRTGFEAYFDKVNSARNDISTNNGIKTSKRGLYPDEGQFNSYSLYSLHHLTLRKWVISAGLRMNQYAIQIDDTTLGRITVTPSALVANAGIGYQVGAQNYVYASYSQGFRAPNLDDMGTLGIVDFRYEVPAYDLKPERSHNIEAGYKFSTQKLQGDVGAYYMALADFITRVNVDSQKINGYQVYKKVNSEQAYIKGVEASLAWKISTVFSARGNLAYAYGQNKSRNEPLRRIPPFNGRISLTYRRTALYGTAEMLFAAKQHRLAKGDMDDNRIPKGGTPGWNVFNIYTGYELKRLKLAMGIQNLTNIDYRTHGSGVNGVGRSAWLSVTISI